MQQKSLAKNAIYKTILNVFNLFVPLLVGPYISGLISKSYYGIYNNSLSWVTLFVTFGSFGIYQYGVRELSKIRGNVEKTNRLFTSLFVIGLLSNILSIIIYIGYYFFSSTSQMEIYVYSAFTIQIIANIFYIEFINEANENYFFIAIKTIVIRLLYLIAVFLFVKKSSDVVIYTIITSMTIFLNNFVSYLYLRRNIKFDFHNFKLKNHIVPLFVTLVLTNVQLLYAQLDKIMLGQFVSKIAVTEYTQPYTVAGMLITIPLSLVTVAIPRVSRLLAQEDYLGYNQVLKDTTEAFLCLIIPISFGAFVLSEEIMWLYTKGVYTYTYPVLALSAITRIIFAHQSIIMHLVMYVNGMEKKMVRLLAMFGMFNVISNFLLILLNSYTPFTSLLTTVIAISLFNIFAFIYCKRSLPYLKLSFFSKRVVGYMIVSSLFIPISCGMKLLDLGYIYNTVCIMLICITLYGIYLFSTKDIVVKIIIQKFHLSKVFSKFGIHFD